MRFLISALLVLLVTGCVVPMESGPGPAAGEPAAPQRAKPEETIDQQGVRQLFTAYKYALLNDLGMEASDLVSERTLRYYDQLRQYALTSEAAELKDQPSYTRMVILAIRHNVPAATLRKMQGRDIFAHGVKNQWIAKDSVAPFEIGAINVYGNYASGQVLHGSTPTKTYLEFRKENGAWRINLVPLLERVGRDRSAQLSAAPDENKAILSIIEKASGRKVDNTIWTPPGAQGTPEPAPARQ